MDGYDSPEMKPPLKQKNREKEIQLAKNAKTFLEKSLENKIIKDLPKKGNLEDFRIP